MQRWRRRITLGRHLGPWARAGALPRVGWTSALVAPSVAQDSPIAVWVYEPPKPVVGAILIAPGLHFSGPADGRLDRFARVLAAAGNLVVSPFIPDFVGQRATPVAHEDFLRVWRWLLDHPLRPRGVKPGVFSISFGSALALRLATRVSEQVGGLSIFGGYAHFRETMRFNLYGTLPNGTRMRQDPLNIPVVLMHLLEHLPDLPPDPRPLLAGWRAFMRATWGSPTMKQPAHYEPVAAALSKRLPADVRPLFLQGCGVVPGAHALAETALERADLSHLDPLPHLHALRCPVRVMHGLADDVIPYTEAHALAAAIAPHTDVSVWISGLYGHTQPDAPIRERARLMVSETRVLWGMLDGLERTGNSGVTELTACRGRRTPERSPRG